MREALGINGRRGERAVTSRSLDERAVLEILAVSAESACPAAWVQGWVGSDGGMVQLRRPGVSMMLATCR